jgi:hypothetical protein
MSSLSFLGNTTSYLKIPNTNDFDFGTGDFTIEWYQYQTDNNPYTRIFQVGNHPTATIGVSIETGIEGGQPVGRFYYWAINGTIRLVKNLTPSSYKNKWVHFAICRADDSTTTPVTRRTHVYMDGISIFSMPDTNNYNGTADLIIGNQSTPSNNTAFGGYIKYFTWVKGVALYNGNFTVPTNSPTLTNNYVLLLTASSFTGTLGSAVVNYNVLPPINVPSNQPNLRMLTPLFTNNAQVYYKPGSLAPGGVGSVRNSSIKARKT